MNDNPYESPTSEVNAKKARPLLWIFALTCWAAAAFLVLGMYILLADPTNAAKRSEWYFPYLLFAVVITLGLPALGLVTIGIGTWIRSRRVALFGVCGFVPIGLVIAYRLWQIYWPFR
jgi:hypothetical protein